MPSGLRRCTRRCRGQLKIFPDRARLPSAISAIPNVPPPGTRLLVEIFWRPMLSISAPLGFFSSQPFTSSFDSSLLLGHSPHLTRAALLSSVRLRLYIVYNNISLKLAHITIKYSFLTFQFFSLFVVNFQFFPNCKYTYCPHQHFGCRLNARPCCLLTKHRTRLPPHHEQLTSPHPSPRWHSKPRPNKQSHCGARQPPLNQPNLHSALLKLPIC